MRNSLIFIRNYKTMKSTIRALGIFFKFVDCRAKFANTKGYVFQVFEERYNCSSSQYLTILLIWRTALSHNCIILHRYTMFHNCATCIQNKQLLLPCKIFI